MGKEKLFFVVDRRNFSYEGDPANRANDLLEFIVKMKLAQDKWIAVYRQNLPETTLSDADIVNGIKEAEEARAAKKRAKKEAKSDTPAQPSPTPEPTKAEKPAAAPAPAPAPTSKPATEKAPAPAPAPAPAAAKAEKPAAKATKAAPAKSLSPDVSEASGTGTGAGSGSPRKDLFDKQEDLDDFINGVLAEDGKSISDRIRGGLSREQITGGAPAAERPAPKKTKPKPKEDVEKTVYLQVPNTEGSKILRVPGTISFTDLQDIVCKKFDGNQMDMEFHDDDGDLIICDDDDALRMFFNQSKKLKLTCVPAGTRRRSMLDDDMTTLNGHGAGNSVTGQNGQPQQALHEEVRTFTGHQSAVYSCAWSPTGDRFATASRDKSVRVWNVNGGDLASRTAEGRTSDARASDCRSMNGGHSGFVLSCDFSPNGEHVVSASDDHTLRMWNTHTGEKCATMRGHSHKVYATQFNSTGAYVVSASCDHTVRVWNADTGSRQATLKGHDLAVFSCGFSNTDCGKYVVSGSDDRQVRIWDWREGKTVRTLQGHTGTVWSCKFSNNDRYIVSASMDHDMKLWDVGSGQVIRSFTGHISPIHHALFTSDDKHVMSCARDWTIMTWNTETGEHIDTLSGHHNTVYHMDILGDQLLTCSLDETVKLWKLRY